MDIHRTIDCYMSGTCLSYEHTTSRITDQQGITYFPQSFSYLGPCMEISGHCSACLGPSPALPINLRSESACPLGHRRSPSLRGHHKETTGCAFSSREWWGVGGGGGRSQWLPQVLKSWTRTPKLSGMLLNGHRNETLKNGSARQIYFCRKVHSQPNI